MAERRKSCLLTEPIFSGSGLNDVSIHVKDRWDTGKLTIDFDYRTDLMTREEIKIVCERMMTLLKNALTHPNHTIDELTLISEAEKERLLLRAGGEPVNYRKNMTIPALFQERLNRLLISLRLCLKIEHCPIERYMNNHHALPVC